MQTFWLVDQVHVHDPVNHVEYGLPLAVSVTCSQTEFVVPHARSTLVLRTPTEPPHRIPSFIALPCAIVGTLLSTTAVG